MTVSIVPVAPKPLPQFHHTYFHTTKRFMLYLLTLILYHYIFNFTTSIVSISITLAWYPLYQWICHQNHFWSTTDAVPIKLWILLYTLMYPLSYHPPNLHCTIFSTTIVTAQFLLPPFNHASNASLLSLKYTCCNFCIHFHVLLIFSLVTMM